MGYNLFLSLGTVKLRPYIRRLFVLIKFSVGKSGIPRKPEEMLKLIKDDLPLAVGEYLFVLICLELAHFLGRKPYKRQRSDGVTVISATPITGGGLV